MTKGSMTVAGMARQRPCPFFQKVQDRLEAWKAIGAPQQVLRWLKFGYKLPFNTPIQPFCFHPWEPPTQAHQDAMKELKNKLLEQGVIKRTTSAAYVSRSRLEPKKDGGFRLVVDLRHLNKHIENGSCKFETLNGLESVLRPNDFMVSFDLKSGYYHVPIHPAHRVFLTTEMDGELVSFCALPFGLSTAPRVFTKVMRPFVTAMRSRGIRVLPYIDDFLMMSQSREEAIQARQIAQDLLQQLGLTRNEEKGYWEPVQDLVHLGIGIDTVRQLFYVPPSKMQTLQGAARSLLKYAKSHCRWVSVRNLAKFVGLAMSLRLALQQVRTYTRALYDAMSEKASWQADVKLSKQAMLDLEFFTTIDESWNGLTIWQPTPQAEIHTDASDYGWGAVLNKVVPARGFFNDEQLQVHITEKELRAVLLGLDYLSPKFQDLNHIRIVTDNQVVKSVVNKGVSRSHQLMPLVRTIQSRCRQLGLSLEATYIASERNVQADQLSRVRDPHDWTVHPDLIRRAEQRWGRRTVDRFATRDNRICQRYNSRLFDPLSLGDAMYASWKQENNWVNPPWPLISRVIRKLREDQAEAVLLLPHWPSASWYPDLLEISDAVEILQHEEVMRLVIPTNPSLPQPLKHSHWRMMLVHVPAGNSRHSQVKLTTC